MMRYRLALPALFINRLVRWLTGGPRAGDFRILLFHDIAPADEPAFATFIEEAASRHAFMTPDMARAAIAGTPPLSGARLLLSFDDGFVSNRAVAERILAPLGIKALFFVCPGLIDLPVTAQRAAVAGGVFDGRIEAGDMAPSLRLMSWDDIRALRDDGHAIGAHGMMHRRLSTLSGDALEAEVADSKSRLETELGDAVDWYAYAFGDIDSISAEAMAVVARHFPLCRSGVRGWNGCGTPPYSLLADHIDLTAPPAYRVFAIEGGLDFRYRAARRRLAGLA